MGPEQAKEWSDVAREGGGWLLFVVSAVVNVVLFRLVIAEKDKHLSSVQQLAPVMKEVIQLMDYLTRSGRYSREPARPRR